jgi:hypothetical protein
MANGYARYSGLGGGGGSGGGVTSLNSETGAITLLGGTGISITPSGQNITITNTGDTTSGNLTDSGTDGITVTNGTGAVLVAGGTQIAQAAASASQNGYLSSANFSVFNGKQAAGNYITALTGDVTATGPGSVAATLATVNTNTGSFGSNTGIPSFTVNGKGLITAASNNSVITTPTASTISAWDANLNLSSNNLMNGFATTITAAGTTTLSITSPQIQFFTGSTTQTVLMPAVSTLPLGTQYQIINLSTGTVTVETSSGTTIQGLGQNSGLVITSILTSGTTTASWDWSFTRHLGTSWPITLGGTGVSGVTISPTATAFAGWDANKNLSANAFLEGFTTTATAAGTTALTISSSENQAFTGSTTQTVTLPTTSVVAGASWTILNLSTGVVTLEASGGATIQAMAANTFVKAIANAATPTTAAGWYWIYGALDSTALPVAVGGTGKTAVTIAPTASSWAGWDANSNFSANAFIEGFLSTATAAGTTALTIASKGIQYFTGSTTQTVTLPTTSIVAGAQYFIANRSTGIVTVQSSGANTIQAMASGTDLLVTALVATPTTAANWDAVYLPQSQPTGSYSQAYFSSLTAQWSTTSTAMGDFTLAAGANTLTVRKSAGINLTAAASSLPGITFTPANAQAAYQISASLAYGNSLTTNYIYLQLTDGTTVIASNCGVNSGNTAADSSSTTIGGIYLPGVATAVTVKLQGAVSAGTGVIGVQNGGALAGSAAVEWTVLRIA